MLQDKSETPDHTFLTRFYFVYYLTAPHRQTPSLAVFLIHCEEGEHGKQAHVSRQARWPQEYCSQGLSGSSALIWADLNLPIPRPHTHGDSAGRLKQAEDLLI